MLELAHTPGTAHTLHHQKIQTPIPMALCRTRF